MTRNGVKTTEFWLTVAKGLVGPILAVLVATGTLLPDTVAEEDVTSQIDNIVAGAIALVGLIMSGLVVKGYSDGRVAVKQIEMQVLAHAPVGESAIGFVVGEMEEDFDEDEDDSDSAVGFVGQLD